MSAGDAAGLAAELRKLLRLGEEGQPLVHAFLSQQVRPLGSPPSLESLEAVLLDPDRPRDQSLVLQELARHPDPGRTQVLERFVELAEKPDGVHEAFAMLSILALRGDAVADAAIERWTRAADARKRQEAGLVDFAKPRDRSALPLVVEVLSSDLEEGRGGKPWHGPENDRPRSRRLP